MGESLIQQYGVSDEGYFGRKTLSSGISLLDKETYYFLKKG
jgi:hypothetical protein